MEAAFIWDSEIRRAIADHHFVAFSYDGARRIAEPHVYGIKGKKRQLLVFQLGGESRSGGLPNWRRVDLDRVQDLRVIDERFQSRRKIPHGGREGFDLVLAGVEPAGFAPPRFAFEVPRDPGIGFGPHADESEERSDAEPRVEPPPGGSAQPESPAP